MGSYRPSLVLNFWMHFLLSYRILGKSSRIFQDANIIATSSRNLYVISFRNAINNLPTNVRVSKVQSVYWTKDLETYNGSMIVNVKRILT